MLDKEGHICGTKQVSSLQALSGSLMCFQIPGRGFGMGCTAQRALTTELTFFEEIVLINISVPQNSADDTASHWPEFQISLD